MKRVILQHVVVPTVTLFVAAVIITVLIPSTLRSIQAGIVMGLVVLLLTRWGVLFARWLRRFKYMEVLAYLWLNTILALGITALFLATGGALFDYVPDLSIVLLLIGVLVGAIWLLTSVLMLIIKRRSKKYTGPFWFFLGPPLHISSSKVSSPSKSIDNIARTGGLREIGTAFEPKKAIDKPSQKPSPFQTTARPSPFHSVTLPANSEPETTFKIPARATHSQPSVAQALNGEPLSSSSLRASELSGNSDFVQMARRYAARKEEFAAPVPFQEYWPSYRLMSVEQQQWYFYWRNQVRGNNLLPTHLSYIFVYVYELINLVGVSSPYDAFFRLDHIWRFYRQAHPKLDNYLVDWIADFMVVYRLDRNALAWYAEAQRIGAVGRGAEDIMTEAWLQQGAKFEDLSLSLLTRLSGYTIERSKFYQQKCNEIDFLAAYCKSLQAVAELEGRAGLFARYLGVPSHPVERPPFQSALHGYDDTPIVIGSAHPWHTYDTLTEELKQILRGVENMLRVEYKYRAKLQGTKLDSSWESVVRQTLVAAKLLPPSDKSHAVVTPSEPIAPQIDLDEAVRIRHEAESLRQRLLKAEEESIEKQRRIDETAEPQTDVPTLTVAVASMQTSEPVSPHLPIRPAGTPDDLLTDLSAVNLTIGSRQGNEARLLELLQQRNWRARQEHLASLFDGGFINVAYDKLNERAYQQLGDAIIFEEEGEWVVAEDYRDEIEYLFMQGDSRDPDHDALGATTPESDEWLQLAHALKTHHWLTLAALHEGDEVVPRVAAVARSVYSTTNQLLDEINEFALDHIGDNIIDISDDLPTLIEEYGDDLHKLLQWSNQNTMIEV